jgi:hypothetical protein
LIDTIWWEATYKNGTTVSETRGAKYQNLDRINLQSFLLRNTEGPIVELTPDPPRTGHNLVYRRRTCVIDPPKHEVVYVLGWIPYGPIFGVAPESEMVYQAADWVIGDPVFYPPVPMLFEQWMTENPTRVVNPAYERID